MIEKRRNFSNTAIKLSDEFISIIKKSKCSQWVITSHVNADPDGLASSLVCYEFLNKINPSNIYVIVFTSVKLLTKKIIKALNLSNIIISNPPENFHLENTGLILVDTQRWDIIENSTWFNYQSSKGDKEEFSWSKFKYRIIIDHHVPQKNEKIPNSIQILESEFSSATELMLELALHYKINTFSRVTLRAAILGMLVDTKRMTTADSITLIRFGELLALSGDSLGFYWNLLNHPRSFSQRIATLKAGKRSQIKKYNKRWIVVFSQVSSFESDAAHHLIILGADCAAVANISKKEIRISFRSQTYFFETTNIHCGKDLAIPIATQFQGTGSGHPTAAGCNLPPTITDQQIWTFLQKLFQKCLEN